ncbi:MAG: hypothetical protein PHQ32_03910 [Firmicutes bacterium]|nr:hypothetical protein [Bacillota bacterium]
MGEGFCVEGFSLVFRGRGSLSSRDEFLLKGNGVEFFLPVYFYRDSLDWVFVYDLEGGYSLGERFGRNDGDISINDFISILERVDYVSGEYFFELGSFYISLESVVYSMKDGGCGLVYCPFYVGDFWGSILSLFGTLFSGELWFGEYLNRLEGLGNNISIKSFVSMVGCFGGGRVDGKGGNVNCMGVEGIDCDRGVVGDGTIGYGGSMLSRMFGVGHGSSISKDDGGSSVLGFDWWGLVVSFVCGGVGNVGCIILLFLFVGFVMGLLI